MGSWWRKKIYGVPRWTPIVAGATPLVMGILFLILGWLLSPCAGYHNPSGYFNNVCHNETAPVGSNSYYCCSNPCSGNSTISPNNPCVAFTNVTVPILAIIGFAMIGFSFLLAGVSIPITRWKIRRYHELDKLNQLDPIQKAQFESCYKDDSDDDNEKSRLM